MSVGLTDNLRPLRAEAYLVSTFRLEPEHFHLTTGTFNLIVKDRIASRLSGALSVHTNPSSQTRIRTSSKPFNRIASVKTLSTLCCHRISTPFAQRGVAHPDGKNTACEHSFGTRRNACFRLKWQGLFGACRQRKTVKSSKIAWRFCFSRNPSGNLVPECEPRDLGSNGGLLNWMPQPVAPMHKQAQTHSHCPRL
jgi:hypothetical protein